MTLLSISVSWVYIHTVEKKLNCAVTVKFANTHGLKENQTNVIE